MAIDLTGSSARQALIARDRVSTQPSNGGAAPVTNTSTRTVSQDTVELSQTAKVLKAADATIANTPDVDSDKVARIKAALDNGSYTIDSQRVAEKMMSFEALME